MLMDPDEKPQPKPMGNKEFKDLMHEKLEKPTNDLKAMYFQFQQKVKANAEKRDRAS